MTEEEVRELIRKKARRHSHLREGSTGVTAWGRHNKVSNSRLSEFMNGKRGPTSDILDALSLEYRIVRKRAARAKGEDHGE